MTTSHPGLRAVSRWITVVAAAGACSGPPRRAAPPAGSTSASAPPGSPAAVPAPGGVIDLAGVVVDARGAPVAGAEVLACTGTLPCVPVERTALMSRRTLAELVGEMRPVWPDDGAALLRTGPDGRWRARLGVHDPSDTVTVLVTAPGAALVAAGGSLSVAAGAVRSIVLSPAVPIDLQPSCAGAACIGPFVLDIAGWGMRHGTAVERLAAGAYSFQLTAGYGRPGERRGRIGVDTRGSAGRVAVPVPLVPTGTGQPIEGTAVVVGAASPGGVSVSATCGDVQRATTADGAGRFRIDDAGPPPCTVEILFHADPRFESIDRDGRAMVTSLPARDVALEVRISRFER